MSAKHFGGGCLLKAVASGLADVQQMLVGLPMNWS